MIPAWSHIVLSPSLTTTTGGEETKVTVANKYHTGKVITAMDAWLDTTRGIFKSSPKPFLRDSFWLLFITGITVSTIVGNLIIILAFLSNHGVRRCKSSRYMNYYQE